MPGFITVILLAVVFTGALAVGQGAYWAWQAREEQKRADLARRLGMISDGANAGTLFRERANDAAAAALGSLGAHLQELLTAADSEMTVSALLGRMAIASGFGFILGLLIGGATAGLLFALVAPFIPYMLIKRAGAARSKKLVEQLPDALDLIARSLQAGVGINDAFRMVAEEMPMPVAGEFGRIFEEIRFGREFRTATEMIIARNPGIFDLRLFVSSVLLARETGGNLIEVLDNISRTIRDRFLFEAKVKAMTSEARFSAVILGGLPLCVGTLVGLSNPAYLRPLIDDPLGNAFLGYSFCSYTFGMFVMNRMSTVEV